MKARVLTTPRADSDARRVAAWWREHRPAAPYLFEHELASAFELLAEAPGIGTELTQPGLTGVRSLLLPRSRYHVYYEVDPDRPRVVVRAIWAAVRGRRPRLRRSC